MPARPDDILQYLAKSPGAKAKDIATALGADASAINRMLYGPLAGKVQKDSQYRWHLTGSRKPEPAGAKAAPAGILARLCRYYLECLEADDSEGDSLFATSKFGDLQYAILGALPFLADAAPTVLQTDDCRRLIQRGQSGRKRMSVRIGYPIRVRRIQTPKWTGLKVEPISSFATLAEDTGAVPSADPRSFFFNIAALKGMPGGVTDLPMSEALALMDELGLGAPNAEAPEWDELFLSLAQIRPLWEWAEPLDPYTLNTSLRLDDGLQPGIYNSAILYLSEQSDYTQGLETELGGLASEPDSAVAASVLGRFLKPTPAKAVADNTPLLEVLPLNNEQRAAVQRALTAPLSVITGPPGTGKSQVVTSILVNAAQRGQTVLFASKNNKAVDVVEKRANGLANTPALVRLGSKDRNTTVAQFISGMMSLSVPAEAEVAHKEARESLEREQRTFADLVSEEAATFARRNTVDRLERNAEDGRRLLPVATFQRALESDPVFQSYPFNDLDAAVGDANRSAQGLIKRIFWPFLRKARMDALDAELKQSSRFLTELGVAVPVEAATDGTIAAICSMQSDAKSRFQAAVRVVEYGAAIKGLRKSRRLEEISSDLAKLQAGMSEASLTYWQTRQRVLPSKLSLDERQALSRYASLLQNLFAGAENVGRLIKQSLDLFPKVRKVLPCWAVTSLSARGRLPFASGIFDLVVIDEASQCDIASALPLLFRGKRAVIIGDGQQLRHVATLPPARDRRLLEKNDLLDTHLDWMYSGRSLFDLALSRVETDEVTLLRDHHRSHSDIIEFSNRHFYGGNLRVATKETSLRRPKNMTRAIEWRDVQGRVTRPGAGSWVNAEEAKAVVALLRDLVLERGYTGTVGVVTPFQAQGALIESVISQDRELSTALAGASFLSSTVHAFQGDERDVMVFSTVVSFGIEAKTLNWLGSNGNLFNVAITRARAALFVVGDLKACLGSPVSYLAEFAKYASNGFGASQAKAPNYSDGEEYPPVRDASKVSDWERMFFPHLVRLGLRPVVQHPVERYELDFAIFDGDRKLNVEVDGQRYHADWDGELCYRDRLRNQRLIELGWSVMRFWVYELRDDLPRCLKQIEDWKAKSTPKAR
jgi:very-short-patch-repair endonuclease